MIPRFRHAYENVKTAYLHVTYRIGIVTGHINGEIE